LCFSFSKIEDETVIACHSVNKNTVQVFDPLLQFVFQFFISESYSQTQPVPINIYPGAG